jgi:hypothetical protein
MDFERKVKLDEIGFEFSVQDKSNEENWNLQFKKLQDYYGKHGHCESFWAVDRVLPSSLNTTNNTLPSSLPAFQVKCHTGQDHWALGLTISVPPSKKVE